MSVRPEKADPGPEEQDGAQALASEINTEDSKKLLVLRSEIFDHIISPGTGDGKSQFS